MKIYKHDEIAPGKECAGCGTFKYVFYDKNTDFFLCDVCRFNKIYPGSNRNKNVDKDLFSIAIEMSKIRKLMNECKDDRVIEIYKKTEKELLKLQRDIESE